MSIEAFFNFMSERHAIYLRRKSPKPWTADPILQQYRFCNVFRELDTVTLWIDRNIRQRYSNHPHLWFMLAIARYINHVDTLEELIQTRQWPDQEGFQPSWLTVGLEHRAARGDTVYTGAYMIRAESNKAVAWYSWSKHRYIAEVVLGNLWHDQYAIAAHLADPGRSLQSVHQLLTRYYGWGPFMAYEVVTDLRHTHYLRDAPDIMTWANPGPGAFRGINRVLGQDYNAPRAYPDAINQMRALLELSRHYLPEGFPPLEMRDIEHTLCEFDKYERVRLGQGKPRSKYQGV